MSDAIHPEARVLGSPVETDDVDFKDLAFCTTRLGDVFFTRMPGDRWEWSLVVEKKAEDDLHCLVSDTRPRTLEEAAHLADTHLRSLVRLVLAGY